MLRLPTELLLEIFTYLGQEDIRSLSLVDKTIRELTIATVFQHIHIEFSTASFHRVQCLCQSPYVLYVRRITYTVPFLQSPGSSFFPVVEGIHQWCILYANRVRTGICLRLNVQFAMD